MRGFAVCVVLAAATAHADNPYDPAALKAQVEMLGLTHSVRFIGHVKPRYGFSKGRLLVVPSRGDSMPYVVFEAGAAGIPMVAARVGGIPEIFGSAAESLFAPGDAGAMANAIEAAIDHRDAALARARSLRERIFLHFSQKSMVEGVLAAYHDAFAAPAGEPKDSSIAVTS